jgi:hypothetical protein
VTQTITTIHDEGGDELPPHVWGLLEADRATWRTKQGITKADFVACLPGYVTPGWKKWDEWAPLETFVSTEFAGNDVPVTTLPTLFHSPLMAHAEPLALNNPVLGFDYPTHHLPVLEGPYQVDVHGFEHKLSILPPALLQQFDNVVRCQAKGHAEILVSNTFNNTINRRLMTTPGTSHLWCHKALLTPFLAAHVVAFPELAHLKPQEPVGVWSCPPEPALDPLALYYALQGPHRDIGLWDDVHKCPQVGLRATLTYFDQTESGYSTQWLTGTQLGYHVGMEWVETITAPGDSILFNPCMIHRGAGSHPDLPHPRFAILVVWLPPGTPSYDPTTFDMEVEMARAPPQNWGLPDFPHHIQGSHVIPNKNWSGTAPPPEEEAEPAKEIEMTGCGTVAVLGPHPSLST